MSKWLGFRKSDSYIKYLNEQFLTRADSIEEREKVVLSRLSLMCGLHTDRVERPPTCLNAQSGHFIFRREIIFSKIMQKNCLAISLSEAN